MSSHKRHLELLPEAEDDLKSIFIYTGQQWGDSQIDVYLSEIHSALDLFQEFPFGGKARDGLSPGLLSRPVRSHVVFYRATDEFVYILRVVHKRMDVTSLF